MAHTMKRIYLVLVAAIGLTLTFECKSPYIVPATAGSVNYLHVEGFINTAGDTTVITLSRTVKLTDSVGSNPELHAAVSVVGNDGAHYALTETGKGIYIYPDFSSLINTGKQYSLKIVTSDGKIYQSDFVPVKNSPPIDSLSFQANANGIQIYSSTHDPSDNTRYYRWDYSETWIHFSYFQSTQEVHITPTDTTIINRPSADQIYTCWVTQSSSTLVLNSSAKLSRDIIEQNPITSIGPLSPKFAVEYSILVSQYALTSDAFNYWENLKKNTEQLGSIFDALPSEIQGNIHCISNPSLPVLGYVSAGFVAKKRLFIGGSAMPRSLGTQIPSDYGGCVLDTFYYKNPVTHLNDIKRLYNGNPLPVGYLLEPFTGIKDYTGSTSFCVDCRLDGGTNQRPSFWIDKL